MKWSCQLLGTQVRGLSKADINACYVDADFISVQTLVEAANVEYMMLLTSGQWGP